MLSYDDNVFLMLGGKEKYLESIAQLVEFAAIREQDSVLEMCCGTGLSTQTILTKTKKVVAVELNRERMDIARERLPSSVPLLMKNALDLDHNDGIYDVIICINGFHYFEQSEQFYALAHRMLCKNGRLIFNVKLHDHNGIRPMHTYMPSVVYNSIIDVQRLDPDRKAMDTAFIDSPQTENTFSVPPLFCMQRSKTYALYYDSKSMPSYIEYLRHVAVDLTGNELFLEGWSGHPTSLAYHTYDSFTRRIHHYISQEVSEEKRLIKAELFVEAIK